MNYELPRWVKWGAACVFLTLPIIAALVSLTANVAYFSQFGQVWMLVAGLSDVARFFLPIVMVILMGKHFFKLLSAYILVSLFSAWAGINFAADTRMQRLWANTEHAEVFDNNKAHIARLARDLGQINEASASVALKGQVETLKSRKAQLETEIDYESDPNKNGPCRETCQKMKVDLGQVMTELSTVQSRLGQALKREQLEKDLAHARQKREDAKPVEVAGFSQFLNFAFGSTVNVVDMSTLLVNVLFYLLLVEGLSHLIGPATATMLHVAYNKPAKEKEEEKNDETTSVASNEFAIETAVFEPMVLAPVEDEVEEQPVVEEEKPVAARKRRRDGRFAKKPGPKPKPKLSKLPRPSGENVVDISDRFKK